MKKVVVDNKKGLVEVDGKSIPRLLLGIIRGAVGKCFVVKHYKGGKRVLTKYPDMSGIVASGKQRERRDLFREAVVYAKWVVGDEERKKAFRKTLSRKKRKHVYQAAIRLYMNMQGDAGWLRKQLAVKAMVRSDKRETSNGHYSLDCDLSNVNETQMKIAGLLTEAKTLLCHVYIRGKGGNSTYLSELYFLDNGN